MAIDPRIVRVGIEIDGAVKYYENLAIVATGTKFANPNQGQCTIDIANLSKETRHYLLKEGSPFNVNRTRKRVILEVGRESYGTSVIYTGDIYRVTQGQPTDIVTTIKCITGGFEKGEIVQRSGRGIERLSSLARRIADDNGLGLNFLADDKNISNYSFTGPAVGQVDQLNDMTDADVFVDAGTLVVKPKSQALPGAIKLVSIDSGMVGIPERTEQGVKVSFFFDPSVKLGSQIRIETEQNPELEGDYQIYKLAYQFTNRDVPFYYIAEARPL